PGVQAHTLQMVDVKTTLNVYEHIQEQMRQYKATQNEEFLKIVVCAAGFTGIELLRSLVENKPKFAEIAGVSAHQIQIYCV
ncbi:NAD(P)/FAD-dependent oxidoreductase, partial [Enterococcus faecalis]